MESKSKELHLRLSPTEKERIEENAKAVNMSVARYIVALSENRRIVDTSKLPPLITEIRRIGININQIVTVANTQKYVSENLLKKINDDQKTITLLLKQILVEVYNADEHTFKSLEHKIDTLIKKAERLEKQNGNS